MDFNTISGIASVLGFTMQSYETFIRKHGNNKINNHMALLIEISPLAEAWKQVHKDYHAILGDVSGLYSLVSVYEGRSVFARAANDVKPSDIRKALASGNLSTAVSDFSTNLQYYIDIISAVTRVGSPAIDAMDEIKRQSPFVHTQITEIRRAAVISLRDHASFCDFLDKIRKPIVTDQYDHTTVQYVIDERRKISVDFNKVISEADRAIIALLQIYKTIVEEVR